MSMVPPVFRFAPSPNGYLHLGHAYSALYNQKICRAYQGKMLLRIENTDLTRCHLEYEEAIIEDLTWLGFEWQDEIRRQSDHFDHYRSILDDLEAEGLVYPAFMTRGEIKHFIAGREEKSGDVWPHDPDGAAHYPGNERHMDDETLKHMKIEHPNHALRLNIKAAQNWLKRQHRGVLNWQELRPELAQGIVAGSFDDGSKPDDWLIEQIRCEPEQWGDIVLGRREIPASYHLACVVDDGLQGVTHVVRGKDILPATSVHRLLQEILGIGDPVYCHHDLIVDDEGRKFSKRHGETSLRDLRAAGLQASDIHKMAGIGP